MYKRLDHLRIIDAAGLAIALTLTAGVYLLGVQPILHERDEHRKQQADYRNLMQQARETEHDLRVLRGHYSRAEQMLSQQSLRLRPMHALNHRLNDVASLAQHMQLRLERIRPHDPEDHRYYHQLPIDLEGTGPFLYTMAFLHQLKEQMPDLGVRSLELTGDPRTEHRDVRFALELVWYASPESRAER